MSHFICSYSLDGQKIAKRLSAQINKETRSIKSLLKDINESGLYSDPVSLEEAFNPSILKLRLQSLGIEMPSTTDNKREIIQAYLTRTRCEEEMQLLIADAKNMTSYYSNLKTAIIQTIDDLKLKTGLQSRGYIAMLWHYSTFVDELLQRSHTAVQLMSKSEPYSPTVLDSNSSDSDLSDDDYF